MNWWEHWFLAEETGCWIWRGSLSGGYAVLYKGYKTLKISRLSYTKYKGEIPLEYIVHHKCENKRCINPEHLEAIPRVEHGKRHTKEFCKYGHALTESNREEKSRRCKICSMKKLEDFNKKRRQRLLAKCRGSSGIPG